jgi:hypothetical protein
MRSGVFVGMYLLAAVVGCRNDVVGDPPLPDAGFEGEGEDGGEGEGEEECPSQPAVSVHLADADRFPICTPGAVTLSQGDFTEVAAVVTDDVGDCRHEGALDRTGAITVAIDAEGFVSSTRTVNVTSSETCVGVPVTARLNLNLTAE